jgi:group I intron endonuclease
MTIGIYKITNTVNGKFYIGSSKLSIERRMIIHKSLLKSNKHGNKHLQSAWNEYGEHNFKFEIYEVMSDKDLVLQREEILINETRSYEKDIGYNKLRKTAENPMLNKKTHGMLGKKHTEKSREKIKNNHADFSGDKNGRAKLTWEEVEQIRKSYFEDKLTLKMLAEKYSRGISTIFHIIKNETWRKNV